MTEQDLLRRIEEQACEIANLKSQNASLLRHVSDLTAKLAAQSSEAEEKF